jgi:hypothetical protein
MKAAVALIAGAALVVGGVVGAASRRDRWSALHDGSLARTEVGAARIGGSIYVVGGFLPPGRTTTAVERYDLAADRWTRVRDMPIGLNHAAAVAYRGDLYVVGGYAAEGGLTQETGALLRYEPGADRWSQLPAMPTRRGAVAAGVVGDRLYVAGGARGGAALRRLEVYDFGTRRWRRGPSMAVAREHLAGAVAGGAFYALAGRAAGRGNFTVVERFLPPRNRWERLPSLRKARGGIAAASVHGRVVVFGGEESAGTIRQVELYTPGRRAWRRLPDMRTPRHGLGGVSFRSGVYALEGGVQPGFSFSSALEALDVR